MSNQIEKYNQLKSEVADFKTKLEASDAFYKVKDSIKGYQILLSPLQYRPDFMFIGINPGAGSYKVTGKVSYQLEPQSKMEYVHGRYTLATQTKEVFELAGLSKEDLSRAVKTNFYFVATENAQILKALQKNITFVNFGKKSKDWNKRLIKMIQPKMILCEGWSAFSPVLQHVNLKVNWDGDVAYTKWKDTHVIGYKRRHSQIIDKEGLANLLVKYHNKL